MLTRRSRKEAVASPDESSNSITKSKKSTTPTRRKSKSVERKLRSRSRSSKRIVPKIVLKRFDDTMEISKNAKKKKPTPVDSKIRKSVTPVKENNVRSSPFVDKSNHEVSAASISSRLTYDKDDVDEVNEGADYELINDMKLQKIEKEFKRSFGNLILSLLSPILVILAIIGLKAKGNLIPFPRGYLRVANYYDQDVFIWTFASLFYQFLISLIPLGKKFDEFDNDDNDVNGNGHYRFSGFFNLIIALLTVVGMNYYQVPIHLILEMIAKKTVPYVVASVLYAFILSLVMFIKAKYIKLKIKYYITNSVLRFFNGTTSYSTLGPINVKLALYKYSWLLTILFNSLVILDSFKNTANVANVHLYFVAGLQILFAIDKLIFEFHLSKSYYLNKEKDGYWTVIQQFIQPAINFLPIQVLLSKNVPVNYVILSISSILFFLGFVCQRYSDFKKYQFYRSFNYPHRHSGITIIADGTGSFIRYPSFLGTIIVHLALTIPIFELNLGSIQSTWPALLYPLYYFVTLAYKCTRMSTYWQIEVGHFMYDESSAKWNLIPKIF
ncbi:lamin-B receptor isoform X2 [Sipha flava]|uniref:Lamin-B receptor isoform X2 n=1 Tax=Sipha flava TaxID=143950 RepID=A0A8B8G071_9HEMI|nr:lamin-B receptor isoform X2 [Sipha flava]